MDGLRLAVRWVSRKLPFNTDSSTTMLWYNTTPELYGPTGWRWWWEGEGEGKGGEQHPTAVTQRLMHSTRFSARFHPQLKHPEQPEHHYRGHGRHCSCHRVVMRKTGLQMLSSNCRKNFTVRITVFCRQIYSGDLEEWVCCIEEGRSTVLIPHW